MHSNQKWNKELCWCECKNPIRYCVYQKDCICNPFTCACEIDKHLKRIFGDTVVTFDETESTKITSITFNEKKRPVK